MIHELKPCLLADQVSQLVAGHAAMRQKGLGNPLDLMASPFEDFSGAVELTGEDPVHPHLQKMVEAQRRQELVIVTGREVSEVFAEPVGRFEHKRGKRCAVKV